MATILRCLLDEALEGHSGAQNSVLDIISRPHTLDEFKTNINLLGESLRQHTFQSLVDYKKNVSGGNFNIAAAYVQLLTMFYDALEQKTDIHSSMYDSARRIFSDEKDNAMIQQGICFNVKLGMV